MKSKGGQDAREIKVGLATYLVEKNLGKLNCYIRRGESGEREGLFKL